MDFNERFLSLIYSLIYLVDFNRKTDNFKMKKIDNPQNLL